MLYRDGFAFVVSEDTEQCDVEFKQELTEAVVAGKEARKLLAPARSDGQDARGFLDYLMASRGLPDEVLVRFEHAAQSDFKNIEAIKAKLIPKARIPKSAIDGTIIAISNLLDGRWTHRAHQHKSIVSGGGINTTVESIQLSVLALLAVRDT